MQITNANPVLAVHDLERSAAWYQAVFGCDIVEVDPGNWTFCRSGAVAFMLGRCPDAAPASEIGDHSYLAYLRVDDIDVFHERAVSAGAAMTKPLRVEPWGMREFGVRSPDGHRFMVGQIIDEEES